MFLTRMVSGLICSKNSNKTVNNQQQQQQQGGHHYQHHQSKAPKPNKKADSSKCKRSLDSKRSMTDLFRSQFKEGTTAASTSTSNTAPTATATHAHQQQSNQFKDVTAKSHKQPTKVKSGSWKRSEKQISTYNAIGGKKSKTLRKRSPTWLKFSNSPMKIAEKTNTNEVTSVCRPGTLYSDVLFGAGSSCLVKIKTLTPRRTAANSAQKKLTKALLRCSGSNDDAASCSESENDHNLFPSLNEFNKSSSLTPSPSPPTTTGTEDAIANLKIADDSCSSFIDGNSSGMNAMTDEGSVDVVILSENITTELTSTSTAPNDCDAEQSYGNYADQHFKQSDDASNAGELQKQPFINIPDWNFVDVSADTYPKFLCQFEDEHYLNTEQMALLGLKLALGNNSQQPKFRF